MPALTGRSRGCTLPAVPPAPHHAAGKAPSLVTDLDPAAPPADTWEALLAALRRRYPGQRDSVLFCIHKLQQNADLTLRDFRAEAELHGIPMAGRSLHSARLLLGLARPEAPAGEPATEPAASAPAPRRRRSAAAGADNASIEAQVVAAVRRMQSAASAGTERLRAAIRQAIATLQRALDEDTSP
jgi:hypothetical protein